jgi:hypothetical protein
MNTGAEIQEEAAEVVLDLKPPPLTGSLQLGALSMPVSVIEKHSAKRYRVMFQVDGSLLVTIPRGERSSRLGTPL